MNCLTEARTICNINSNALFSSPARSPSVSNARLRCSPRWRHSLSRDFELIRKMVLLSYSRRPINVFFRHQHFLQWWCSQQLAFIIVCVVHLRSNPPVYDPPQVSARKIIFATTQFRSDIRQAATSWMISSTVLPVTNESSTRHIPMVLHRTVMVFTAFSQYQ